MKHYKLKTGKGELNSTSGNHLCGLELGNLPKTTLPPNFQPRRWPREADAALQAGMPEINEPFCDPLPEGRTYAITKARLSVQSFDQKISVSPGDKAAVFEVPLKKGQTKLQAWFTFDGNQTVGAYYVYIVKI